MTPAVLPTVTIFSDGVVQVEFGGSNSGLVLSFPNEAEAEVVLGCVWFSLNERMRERLLEVGIPDGPW